jgi:hypothetical protein
MPRCSNCHEDLHRTCFSYVRKDNTGVCTECRKAIKKEKDKSSRAKNKEFVENRLRDIGKTKKPRRIKKGVYFKYGMSEEDYMEMFSSQDGRCLICNGTQPNKRLAVDHNHLTGDVRGLLCSKCNSLIGLAGENPSVLVNASIYLMKSQREILKREISKAEDDEHLVMSCVGGLNQATVDYQEEQCQS